MTAYASIKYSTIPEEARPVRAPIIKELYSDLSNLIDCNVSHLNIAPRNGGDITIKLEERVEMQYGVFFHVRD